MNWDAFLVGMVPEHFLLAGIVLVIAHSIVFPRGRGAAAITFAVVFVAAVSALGLGLDGYRGEPFVAQLAVTRSPPSARRWRWCWRCRCCCWRVKSSATAARSIP